MDPATASIRVLHVDDEPAFGEVVTEFLERADEQFAVTSVTSVDAALDRLGSAPIDCVVSDYQMPDRDGLDLLAVVRAEEPTLPFILFTGQGNEAIASEAISAGVTDYLQKGPGTDQYAILANRVRNAVAGRRAEQRSEHAHRAMDTASEGISLVAPDGTFSYVNPAFATLFGYDRDALVGDQWTTLYHEEEAQRLETTILPAVRETGYWAGETVRLTADGERLVTDHRLAHTDADVIVCTARDVTPEREAPTAHRGVVDLLEAAIDEDVFFTLDHEGYVTRWTQGARQRNGYEVGDAIGVHLATFFPDGARADGLPTRLLDAAQRDGRVTHEGPLVRSDGTAYEATVTIAATYDDNGTLRGFGTVLGEPTEPPIAASA